MRDEKLFFIAWDAGPVPLTVGQRRLHMAVLAPLALLAFAALTACGPPSRTSQSLAAAQPTIAPSPAPKTLESTLQLGPDVEEIPFYPQSAESAHGDIVAVWEQFDGAHYSIWGNSRRAHQGWGRAQLIQTSDSAHSYNPRVAINAQGQAAAVWVQMDSALGTNAIWSSRLEPGAAWGAAVQVESGKAGPTYAPGIAIDDRGHAVAAWQQSDGRRVNVRASRFTPGVGWGQASRLEHGEGELGAPEVAMDADGNALVVWPRFHLNRSELWASGHAVGSSGAGGGGGGAGGGAWDKATRIDAVPGYVYAPRVMAAAGVPGQFAVLWDQEEGFVTGPASVWASQYQPGRGWRASSARCANKLQALATARADKGGLAASARPLHTAEVDNCY